MRKAVAKTKNVTSKPKAKEDVDDDDDDGEDRKREATPVKTSGTTKTSVIAHLNFLGATHPHTGCIFLSMAPPSPRRPPVPVAAPTNYAAHRA